MLSHTPLLFAMIAIALLLLVAAFLPLSKKQRGTPLGRFRFADAIDPSAFPYRMGAGYPGDINRTHPASVEPAKIDASAPPTGYGQPVLYDATTNGVRPFAAGDQSDTVAKGVGVTVRPYPIAQRSGGDSASFGAATPPTSGPIDILKYGYIMVQLNDVTAVLHKGDPVYVWAVATSTIHTQAGIEAVASAGNTTQLKNAYFNGPADANGVAEIFVDQNL